MNPLTKYQSHWFDPLETMSDLQGDINRLFSTSLRRSQPGFAADYFPAVDLHESETQYALSMDVPGMERKDLDISVTGNTLTVKGERKSEEKKKEKGWFYSERKYGFFQRSIELPTEVDGDKITATYKDGVLELLVPKSEKARPKQIRVDVK
ncbi:MAG TPA: Hsp20/alpha crystallin family protein [Candidatus Omnitrophota bacterium]|nr:Hsp20/alpha crystallin family protein [Candidatus Omnitrophota bacterium]HPS37433.1 Hsp20/alpha crystallin family protein [Candidatus Omnitrophota bacterium]